MGLIARIKTWIATETLTAAALNAEFNNILDNMLMEKMNDFSNTVAQMRLTLDPGAVGTEVQATNSAEELKQIRAMLVKITGETYWYTAPDATLSGLNASIGTNLPSNRIVSGAVDGNNHPYFLQADGATLNLKLEADSTTLAFVVDDAEYSKSADATVSVTGGLTAKEANWHDSVNTGEITKYLGEMEGTIILFDPANTDAEIISRLNERHAFKTTNGADTEYLIGTIRYDGASYYLENCRRGFFKDSAGTAQRVELTGAQPFTLLQLSYIFIKSDGTLTFCETNNEPVVSGVAPSAPIANDRWFNTVTKLWNKYSGAAWAASGEAFLGHSCQGVGIVEGARSVDFYAEYKPLCDVSLKLSLENPDEIIENFRRGGKVNVNGTDVDFQYGIIKWDNTSDLDTGSVAANKRYYAYLTDTFIPKLSLIKPYDRQGDLKGQYHPYKPWRCLGYADTDATSDFESIVCYGSEDYLADHALTTRKLSRYKFGTDQDSMEDVNGVSYADVNISATGQSNSFGIITSGRPVLLLITGGRAAADAILAAATESVTLNFQRRDLPDTTWNDVHNDVRWGSVTAGVITVGPSFVFIDNPGPGQKEYRIDATLTGVGSISGRIYAIEL